MKGGRIVIEGSARHQLGGGMDGGEILVEGNVESFCGIRQNGGLIFVKGNALRGVGAEMAGGTIVIGGKIERFSPGFAFVSMPNKTLLVSSSAVSKERSTLNATIDYIHSDSAENNLRILISHYLVGYDVIRLTTKKGFSAYDRKFIKDSVRQKLIGLELIEESRNELVFQCLLNYNDLPLTRVIRNMFSSMPMPALLGVTLRPELQ